MKNILALFLLGISLVTWGQQHIINGKSGQALLVESNSCQFDAYFSSEHELFPDPFHITIDSFKDLKLGKDIELKAVQFSFRCSRPSSLDLVLVSPSGETLHLYHTDQATQTHNIGNPDDAQAWLTISDQGEKNIGYCGFDEEPEGCMGTWQPYGLLAGKGLTTFNDSSLVNGKWELQVCNTTEMAAYLEYFELVFELVSGTTALQSIDQSTLHIQPNPAHDVLHVRTENMANATITLRNTLGQTVKTTTVTTPSTTVDVSDLPRGTYQLFTPNTRARTIVLE